MLIPTLFLTMMAAPMLHKIDYTLHKVNMDTYSYKVNVLFNNVEEGKKIGKPLSLQLKKNPIYSVDQFYLTHNSTIWKNKKAIYQFDMKVVLVNDYWFLHSYDEYPLGYIEGKFEGKTYKSNTLSLKKSPSKYG